MSDHATRRSWTKQWLDRWLAGDHEAVGQLYAYFLPLLRHAARTHRSWSTLRHRYSVDDIVDGLWARILASRKQGHDIPSGGLPFARWLRLSLDNYLTDSVRHESRTKRAEVRQVPFSRELSGVPVASSSPAESPEITAIAHDLAERLRHILKDVEYNAFVLTKVRGYTSEEAGLALRKTGSAVRAMVSRAQRRLLVELKETPTADTSTERPSKSTSMEIHQILDAAQRLEKAAQRTVGALERLQTILSLQGEP